MSLGPPKTWDALDRLNFNDLVKLYPNHRIAMLSFWQTGRDSDWWNYSPNEWNGESLVFGPSGYPGEWHEYR